MSNSPTLVRRSQLGELLLAEGKLSRAELEAALAYREERGLKLGQALVALHLVTQQELATALRSQGRIHCLHLTPGIVETEVARLLPEEMARQYVAVPVHRVAGRITVAMEDPSEEYDVAAIAIALGEPVFPVHAEPERILEAIARVHPGGPSAAPTRAATPVDAPRFTLVRGPLPESDPDEAAEVLVRSALREARAIGAESLHMECTDRGAEMSFRIEGVRTPAAIFATEWADACRRSIARLLGAAHPAARAAGTIELDGSAVAIDAAMIDGFHGPCTRVRLCPSTGPVGIAELPLEPEECRAVESWLDAGRGLFLVVGSPRSGADALAGECATRAAAAGRRVYQLGSGAPPTLGTVAIPRDSARSLAEDLRAVGEQSPDVLQAGPLVHPADWCAAVDVARTGVLVIARVEAHDGAAALATMLRAAKDPDGAARVCLGVLALRAVRLLCPACRTDDPEESPAPGCAACSNTGRAAGSVRIAELLEAAQLFGCGLDRGANAHAIRVAVRELGRGGLDDRARELIERGLASTHDVDRAGSV
jgi:type II secretory ATPase GspE/PulE/Tfp pilus assembly ATPase PilB-like protein